MALPTVGPAVAFTVADLATGDDSTLELVSMVGKVVGTFNRVMGGVKVVVDGENTIERRVYDPVLEADDDGLIAFYTDPLYWSTSTTSANMLGGAYEYYATVRVKSVLGVRDPELRLVRFRFITDEQESYNLDADGRIPYAEVSTDAASAAFVAPIEDVLAALLGVDGTGSGLDADLLDGLHAAAFLQAASDLSDVADAETARTNLGLEIGVDVQAWAIDPDASFGHVGRDATIGTGGDDTDAINAIIAAADEGNGCTVIVPPGVYNVEGTIELAARQTLHLAGGAVLQRPTSTNHPYPVVRLGGNWARLLGDGLVKNLDPTPQGIVKFGPEEFVYSTRGAIANSTAVVTDASAPFGTANVGDRVSVEIATGGTFTHTTIASVDSASQITLNTTLGFSGGAHVFWMAGTAVTVLNAHARHIRIEGAKTAGNIGLLAQSVPQGSGFGTYGCQVHDVSVKSLDTAVLLDAQANASMVRGLFAWDIASNYYWLRSVDECQTHGGFLYFAAGSTTIRMEDCFAASLMQVGSEPGAIGSSIPYNIDAKCLHCLIQMTENLGTTAGTNLGTQITILTRRSARWAVDQMSFYDRPPVTRPATAAAIWTTGLASAGPVRSFGWVVFEAGVTCTVGDGIAGFVAPAWMAGYNVTDVQASVTTPGTTGTMDIQLRRVRAGTAVDVLSTPVTINSGAYTAADEVVNTSNDDVAAGDMFFVDRDAVHSTPAKGLSVVVTVQLS